MVQLGVIFNHHLVQLVTRCNLLPTERFILKKLFDLNKISCLLVGLSRF